MLPKEKGPCIEFTDRFYFDTAIGKCSRFHFGGCYGNLNNFRTFDECAKTCESLMADMKVPAIEPINFNMSK